MYDSHSQSGVATLSADDCQTYPKNSVYTDCIEEENRHRWIESEKAGYDLGEAVIRRWVKEHWTGYLRGKWVEHLQGKCFWTELDRGDFGLLLREFKDCPKLLEFLIARLLAGLENLPLLAHAIWLCNDDFPTDRMIEILTSLDINSKRLRHRFDQIS